MNDKRKNDRRISIVLNGEEKLYHELDRDKHRYEELLNKEICATNEDQGEEFQWVLSENTDKTSTNIIDFSKHHRDKKKLTGPYWDDGKSDESPKIPFVKRKKKRKLNLKALPLGVIGIVVSAIVVGVSFGLMMLTIFTEDPLETIEATTNQPLPVNQPIEATSQLPVLGVEIIQGGAFSNFQKGEQFVQSITDKGFAALLTTTTDPHYMFIGVGLDRGQANALAEIYKENGQDIYVKPYAITSERTVTNEGQGQFLQKGVDLYGQLANLSVNGLTGDGSLISDEGISQLTKIEEALKGGIAHFQDDNEKHSLAVTFQTELTSAFECLQSYFSIEDQAQLWKLQQHLLNGLLSYEQLVQSYK